MSINAIVVAVVGGIVAWLGKGRFETIDRRFEGVDRRFDSVDRRFDRLESSLDALRSDLTRVALAVGVRPPSAERLTEPVPVQLTKPNASASYVDPTTRNAISAR